MTQARQILVSRCREIRAMQRYILAIDAAECGVSLGGVPRADAVLVKNSIKAAFILMLYNLAEAVVVSTIHEIFERVGKEKLGYSSVSASIKEFWLLRRAARVQRGTPGTHAKLLREAIESAFNGNGLEPFKREEIRSSYSGNVDGRLIRELAKELAYQFAPRSSSRAGEPLLMIKTKRNDLGHGVFSFDEVGATHSAGDLRETSIRVRRFLLDSVFAFESYIRNRGFASDVCNGVVDDTI